MNGPLDTAQWLLGLDADSLSVWQMAIRALIVYAAAVMMVRVGEKRFLGKNTAFDVILGIILGSVVSRAITGSSPFFPTLGAGFVLVGLHWSIAVLAFRSERLATLVKGESRLLIRDGKVQQEAIHKSHIGERDLLSALRVNGQLTSVSDVAEAHLERSGDISVIERETEREPVILDVAVEDGVQTVRIKLG
ncbi:MAG TPA: YetF domain-containing protein [Thermomicrobiales bacterium]|nr:YetF domain-containing protein [Thermomicrobiales bacterium]